jgi:hypothetical protein
LVSDITLLLLLSDLALADRLRAARELRHMIRVQPARQSPDI